jgi:hypothetical protein
MNADVPIDGNPLLVASVWHIVFAPETPEDVSNVEAVVNT